MSIICIAWKTDIMPAHAFVYYHAACYKAAKPVWPNEHRHEVTTTDVRGTCAHCLEPLSEQHPQKSMAV